MLDLRTDGSWVKGALHCHSTASDGALSPADVIGYYVSKGYGVVAVTDHGRITRERFEGEGIVVLPGIEMSKGGTKLGSEYHMVALGIDDQSINDLGSPSEIIDEVNSAGGIVIVAHPYWSGLVYDDLVDIEGYAGIEVYNTGCEVEVMKGYSAVHWDELLSSGVRCFGFAVDDAHRYFIPPLDADGGWVWFKPVEANVESVLKALKGGLFYSSTGPSINRLVISEDTVHVDMTPVSRLNVISRNGIGLSVELEQLRKLIGMWREPDERRRLEGAFERVEVVEEGGLVNAFVSVRGSELELTFDEKGLRTFHAEVKLGGNYLRVELVDEDGRVAWSNPIFLSRT